MVHYSPPDEVVFVRVKGVTQRMIFNEPHALQQNELDEIKKFRKWLEASSLTLPPGYDDHTRNVLRYL